MLWETPAHRRALVATSGDIPFLALSMSDASAGATPRE